MTSVATRPRGQSRRWLSLRSRRYRAALLPCTGSNARAQFTLVANNVSVVLDGERTVKGIKSRRKPGAACNSGTQYASWYALKTS
jgi:hypothetical protein